MRQLRWLTAALVVVATGCGSSDSSTEPTNTNLHGSMSAKIDGVAWSATAAVVATRSSPNIIAIAGADASGRTLAIGVAANGTGTYSIGQGSPVNASLTQSGSSSFSAISSLGSGSVTLTTLTATGASGTFAFTLVQQNGTATRAITEGSFNVTF